jgi:hypothetical protein
MFVWELRWTVVQEVYVNSLRAVLVCKISNTGQGLTDKIPRLLLSHLNEITQDLYATARKRTPTEAESSIRTTVW